MVECERCKAAKAQAKVSMFSHRYYYCYYYFLSFGFAVVRLRFVACKWNFASLVFSLNNAN